MPPSDAPEGTISFGGPIEWFSIALIIHAETLPLERISELLGCAPTRSFRKDEPILRRDGSVMRVPNFSNWVVKLSPNETDEWDLCEAAKLLLSRLNSDPSAWREISSVGRIRLSFGLSIDESNRGFSFDVDLMRYLSERGIEAGFDIYTDDFDLPSEFPLPRPDRKTH
jgi:hypothetical protein